MNTMFSLTEELQQQAFAKNLNATPDKITDPKEKKGSCG
jgi:hypothetical protein